MTSDRHTFEASLTRAEIDALASDRNLKVLQTAGPVDDATWERLNEGLFTARPEVYLRVYGFYSSRSKCDLSFLVRLPNLRHFAADCLMHATGVEHLAFLSKLESLSIGIYDLTSFDFLADLPADGLEELSLCATKSKKPTLGSLTRFHKLRKLYLEGQQKEITAISSLPSLEELTLRSISVDGLDFLTGLDRLWSLDIKLGGTNNLAALRDMNGIKYLELWHVRDLRDLSPVSTMHGLQYLFLQSLPHIHALPDLSRLTSLRRVFLENMKGLRDLAALAAAPALEDFYHCDARGMELEHYQWALANKSLKQMSVGFGSDKKNKAFRDWAARMGFPEYRLQPFVFT